MLVGELDRQWRGTLLRCMAGFQGISPRPIQACWNLSHAVAEEGGLTRPQKAH